LQTFWKKSPEIGNNGFVISRFFLVSCAGDKNKLCDRSEENIAHLFISGVPSEKVYLWCGSIFIERNYSLVNRLTSEAGITNMANENIYLSRSCE
jgi:hypothetical protein